VTHWCSGVGSYHKLSFQYDWADRLRRGNRNTDSRVLFLIIRIRETFWALFDEGASNVLFWDESEPWVECLSGRLCMSWMAGKWKAAWLGIGRLPEKLYFPNRGSPYYNQPHPKKHEKINLKSIDEVDQLEMLFGYVSYEKLGIPLIEHTNPGGNQRLNGRVVTSVLVVNDTFSEMRERRRGCYFLCASERRLPG